jgi:hypothetical protein
VRKRKITQSFFVALAIQDELIRASSKDSAHRKSASAGNQSLRRWFTVPGRVSFNKLKNMMKKCPSLGDAGECAAGNSV